MPDRIISASAVAAFRRCPKQFQLSYIHELEWQGVPQYVTDGAGFHQLAAIFARARRDGTTIAEEFERAGITYDDGPMTRVFEQWLTRRGLPGFEQMHEIITIEEPLYTYLCTLDETRWFLRTTFDLVYRTHDGWIVCRDYKTFDKAPSTDVDLDFQSGAYLAALMRKFQTQRVMFEHEYVRRTPPGEMSEGVKAGKVWTPDDCYLTEPKVISRLEADELWAELHATIRTINWTERELGVFARVGLKGKSPYTCGSCFMRDLCKAELEGNFNEQTIALLNYTRREQKDVVPA